VHSVQFLSSGLLQVTVLRVLGSDDPAAVCPECDWTSCVGRSTVRPHHASATGAALSSGSGGFQDSHPPWSICHCPAWLQQIRPWVKGFSD